MSDNDPNTPQDESYEVDTSDNTAHVDIQPTTPQAPPPAPQVSPAPPPADPPPQTYLHEIPTFPIPTYVVNPDPTPDDPDDDVPEDEE